MQIETPTSFNNVVSIVQLCYTTEKQKLNHFQFNNYANALLDEVMEVAGNRQKSVDEGCLLWRFSLFILATDDTTIRY